MGNTSPCGCPDSNLKGNTNIATLVDFKRSPQSKANGNCATSVFVTLEQKSTIFPAIFIDFVSLLLGINPPSFLGATKTSHASAPGEPHPGWYFVWGIAPELSIKGRGGKGPGSGLTVSQPQPNFY